jgi:hypothetical protein
LRAGRDLPVSGGAAVEQRGAYDLAKFFAEVAVVEPRSPFAQDEIRTTRCNSFEMSPVSIGRHFHVVVMGRQNYGAIDICINNAMVSAKKGEAPTA